VPTPQGKICDQTVSTMCVIGQSKGQARDVGWRGSTGSTTTTSGLQSRRQGCRFCREGARQKSNILLGRGRPAAGQDVALGADRRGGGRAYSTLPFTMAEDATTTAAEAGIVGEDVEKTFILQVLPVSGPTMSSGPPARHRFYNRRADRQGSARRPDNHDQRATCRAEGGACRAGGFKLMEGTTARGVPAAVAGAKSIPSRSSCRSTHHQHLSSAAAPSSGLPPREEVSFSAGHRRAAGQVDLGLLRGYCGFARASAANPAKV